MKITLILFIIGWIFGRYNEKKHLKELEENERLVGHIIISSERFYQPKLANASDNGELVLGSVVIAQDYFKMIIANILSIFGRNLVTYESLLERARREAILRMKQEAQYMGFNQVYGVRLEVTNINEMGQMVEAVAYGTGIKSVGNPKVPPDLPMIS